MRLGFRWPFLHSQHCCLISIQQSQDMTEGFYPNSSLPVNKWTGIGSTGINGTWKGVNVTAMKRISQGNSSVHSPDSEWSQQDPAHLQPQPSPGTQGPKHRNPGTAAVSSSQLHCAQDRGLTCLDLDIPDICGFWYLQEMRRCEWPVVIYLVFIVFTENH